MIAARHGPRIPLVAALFPAAALAECSPPRAREAERVLGDIAAGADVCRLKAGT